MLNNLITVFIVFIVGVFLGILLAVDFNHKSSYKKPFTVVGKEIMPNKYFANFTFVDSNNTSFYAQDSVGKYSIGTVIN